MTQEEVALGKPRSKAQLEAENDFLRRGGIAQSVSQVLQTLIRWGAGLGIAYFLYLIVDSLAGRTTLADIGISFLANVQVSVALAWAVGAGGIGYGALQQKLRKDTVERLQSRIQELEATIDPGRTSSTLTVRGDTRAEDMQ